jgi:hypothetical protein
MKRVNRLIGAQPNMFFLNSQHFFPLVIATIFGLSLGAILNLSYWQIILLILWPFVTWILAVGRDPRQFLGRFYRRVPHWNRSRIYISHPLEKPFARPIRR